MRSDLEHEGVEEKSLDEKLPSVVTDAEGNTLAKDTKSKKGIIGSQPRGNVFTHFPKDPNCEVCKKTRTTRAGCRLNPMRRVDGGAFSTIFGDVITADNKIQNVENESRCGHKRNAPIVQDDFTNWIQRYPMKTKESSEIMSCL